MAHGGGRMDMSPLDRGSPRRQPLPRRIARVDRLRATRAVGDEGSSRRKGLQPPGFRRLAPPLPHDRARLARAWPAERPSCRRWGREAGRGTPRPASRCWESSRPLRGQVAVDRERPTPRGLARGMRSPRRKKSRGGRATGQDRSPQRLRSGAPPRWTRSQAGIAATRSLPTPHSARPPWWRTLRSPGRGPNRGGARCATAGTRQQPSSTSCRRRSCTACPAAGARC